MQATGARRAKSSAVAVKDLGESRFQLLFELSPAVAEIKDLEVLLHSIATRCRELFGHGSEVAIMLLDRDTEELYFPYTDTQRPLHMPQLTDVRIPAGPGTLSGAVMESGRSELVADVDVDPRFNRAIQKDLGRRMGSVMIVPLRTRDGMVGVITVSGMRDVPPFSPDDLSFLENLGSYVALAIENARIYERLRTVEEDLRVEVGALRADLERRDLFPEIIGTSTAIRELVRLMESAAASPYVAYFCLSRIFWCLTSRPTI